MASGAKFGYLEFETGAGDTDENIVTMDFTVPLYVSYYPVDWVALTVIPDYTFRVEEGGNSSIYGANTNVKLGKDAGLVIEYGYHISSDETIDAITQVGVGFYSNFKTPFGD